METQKDGQLTFLEAWATHQISHTWETKQHGNLMGSSGNWEQLGMGVLHQPKGSTKLHSINRDIHEEVLGAALNVEKHLEKPWKPQATSKIGIIKPKSSCRHQYILVAIDYFSKWAKAVPLKVVKAEDVANFIKTHIIHHYGVPSKIISDNALYFKCKTVVKLCDKYNIWHSFFASYSPQSNGQAEAFNKVLCNILKKIVSGTKKDWHEHLPEALWAYRTTVRTSIGCTPYSLVYGSEAILPLEIPLPSLRVATHLVNPDENVKVMLAELEALDKNASPCNINSKFTKLKWQVLSIERSNSCHFPLKI
ncbi:unnamed protein product [Prunus armeniaca]